MYVYVRGYIPKINTGVIRFENDIASGGKRTCVYATRHDDVKCITVCITHDDDACFFFFCPFPPPPLSRNTTLAFGFLLEICFSAASTVSK